MKSYPVQLEISGLTAMWTRPDTGSSPVSNARPPYSLVNDVVEAITQWKFVLVRSVKSVG